MRIPGRLPIAIIGALAVTLPAFGWNAAQKKLLDPSEIRITLTGKLVSYSPPGWADAGLHEEFHEAGVWKGVYYSRGPIGFSGRWEVQKNQLCVLPDRGTIVAAWFAGQRCRNVWRIEESGQLLMEDLKPDFAKLGPLPLSVKDLRAFESLTPAQGVK